MVISPGLRAAVPPHGVIHDLVRTQEAPSPTDHRPPAFPQVTVTTRYNEGTPTMKKPDEHAQAAAEMFARADGYQDWITELPT